MPKSVINVCALSFFLFFALGNTRADSPASDSELLQAKRFKENDHLHHHDVRFMRTRSSNILIRYNPLSLGFGGMMFMYQRFISPQLPSQCLYVESCSYFSKNLIYEYGLIKGVFTTSDRLMRCNRVSALDVHPLFIDQKTGRVQETVEIYKVKP